MILFTFGHPNNMAINLDQRIQCLLTLGRKMADVSAQDLVSSLAQAERENPWFTRSGLLSALHAIRTEFLTEDSLRHMVARYRLDDNIVSKRVGIIMAGNLPLVGFHDLMCCFLAGHHAIVKYSNKDAVMMRWVVGTLSACDPEAAGLLTATDVLKDYDAVIATGSNASAAQFRYYFRHVPHIIRQNRNSVAVIRGDESPQDLEKLGEDIFSYFGMGCRNVSHICVPEGYDITALFEAFRAFRDVVNHHKYKNNFDYNLAVFLLNKEPFLHNEFLILRESEQIISRIAVLHYHRYSGARELEDWLTARKDQIQCVVSQEPVPGFDHVSYGLAQCPTIDTYADGVDTMQFLLSI